MRFAARPLHRLFLMSILLFFAQGCAGDGQQTTSRKNREHDDTPAVGPGQKTHSVFLDISRLPLRPDNTLWRQNAFDYRYQPDPRISPKHLSGASPKGNVDASPKLIHTQENASVPLSDYRLEIFTVPYNLSQKEQQLSAIDIYTISNSNRRTFRANDLQQGKLAITMPHVDPNATLLIKLYDDEKLLGKSIYRLPNPQDSLPIDSITTIAVDILNTRPHSLSENEAIEDYQNIIEQVRTNVEQARKSLNSLDDPVNNNDSDEKKYLELLSVLGAMEIIANVDALIADWNGDQSINKSHLLAFAQDANQRLNAVSAQLDTLLAASSDTVVVNHIHQQASTLATFTDATVPAPSNDSNMQTSDGNTTTPVVGNGGPLNWPFGCHSDGTHLIVSDFRGNRVFIWNSVPTSNGIAPDIVLGQATFDGNQENTGSDPKQWLRGPKGVYSTGRQLFIVDSMNNRILVWNNFPTANHQAADAVIGQASTSSTLSGTSASRLRSPSDVYFASGRLFVADRSNGRVLIWNTVPTITGIAADVVIGQPDFTTANQDAPINEATLHWPSVVYSDGTRLWVGEDQNGVARVLIWNNIPGSNYAAADVVLGQASLTANDPKQTSSVTNVNPSGITSDGTRLAISDNGAGRILIWNSIPTNHNQAADVVLGQSDFTTRVKSGPPSAKTMTGVAHIAYDGTQFIACDADWGRVLMWNGFPTDNHQAADFVVGPENLVTPGTAAQ